LDRLIIATDDRRIAEESTRIGAESMMTSPDHLTGTDRVAEVVESLDGKYDIAINIQGDEPLLTPTSIDNVIEVFDRPPVPDMATLAEPIVSIEELFDPNAVKLVTDSRGRALYFSRSPIPFFRGSLAEMEIDFRKSLRERRAGLAGFRKHPGIYAYTRQTLLELTRLEPSSLELDEDLEQLRALEAGYVIQVVNSDFCSFPVDTPADLERAAKLVTEAD
jgi:3-deoxy-manno-octulosonate cytidylyltransferase (CMP-KDO synthetase)